MLGRGSRGRCNCCARRAALIGSRAGALAAARCPGSLKPLGWQHSASLLAPFDFAGIELTPPTRTFEGTLQLDVGGRTVEVMEVGPAHTPGDAIVHVPDARTVFAADVMFRRDRADHVGWAR